MGRAASANNPTQTTFMYNKGTLTTFMYDMLTIERGLPIPPVKQPAKKRKHVRMGEVLPLLEMRPGDSVLWECAPEDIHKDRPRLFAALVDFRRRYPHETKKFVMRTVEGGIRLWVEGYVRPDDIDELLA